jgi:nitroreductase
MSVPVATDTIGLLEGLMTTRAIRRYQNEPIPDETLRDILFAAKRAPSGSNRQPFRFVVLTNSSKAVEAKRLILKGAQAVWSSKRKVDQYDQRSGTEESSPKARMARTMDHYVD